MHAHRASADAVTAVVAADAVATDDFPLATHGAKLSLQSRSRLHGTNMGTVVVSVRTVMSATSQVTTAATALAVGQWTCDVKR